MAAKKATEPQIEETETKQETAKPKKTTVYLVLGHLSEDGTYYPPGSTIELTVKRAESLGDLVGEAPAED